MSTILNGGCLCGAVRYEAAGAPVRVTHCHCIDCRRASAAAFVTWATFRKERLRITRGETRAVSWAGRVRGFCPACGTPLTFESAPDAEEIDVTVCSLDDPGSLTPTKHIFLEDRIAWVHLADGLPGYEGEPGTGG